MSFGLNTTRRRSGHQGDRFGPAPAGTHGGPPFVPPELWSLVFLYLGDRDLRAVTRTFSAFRLLAQPFLFQVLDVCPFFLAYNADRPIYRPQQYLQTTLERLEFYKIPRIAPAVTHLWISPYTRHGYPPRRLTDDLDPVLIISAIINALPAFPNLRCLTWHCIDIRPSWWAAIQRQSSLTKLWVNSCSISEPSNANPTRSGLPLRIAHLDLDQWAWDGHVTNHVSIHEERLKGVDPTLLSTIISTENTRSVSVPREDTALHLLHILVSLDFVSALIATTSLKELRLLPPLQIQIRHPDLRDKLPSSSVPLLEIYEGPYHLLPFFSNPHNSRPRRLRFLDLWGLDEPMAMTVCDPHRLEMVLEELSLCDVTLQALETINILMTHITIELMVILGRFLNLKEVFLESQDSLIPNRISPLQSSTELLSDSSVSMLYDLLRSRAFSSSLQHLTITTHLKNIGGLESTAQYTDAAKFLESLGQVNQHLQTIDVRYGTYWTGIVDIYWRRRVPHAGSKDIDVDKTSPDVGGIVNGPWTSDTLIVPPVSRSNTSSSLSSVNSDSSQAAVDRFFSLPSKPKSTATIRLPLGDLTVSEQRRAGLLTPERNAPLQEAKVNVPGFGWLTEGMNKLWCLVGRVRRNLGGAVGISRN